MTQPYHSVPSPAKNSSADANPRAPYPSEDNASTSATRNASSSSMTAIKGSVDTTYHPLGLREESEARNRKFCYMGTTMETIQEYRCCCSGRYGRLGLITSAIRTRSAKVRA